MIRGLILSTVLGAVLAAAPAEAKLKIGVVNMQRAVSETSDGKKAEGTLKMLKKKLEDEINGKMKAAYDNERQLRKQWSILKDAEKRKRAEESMKRMEGLRKEYMLAERKLMERKTKEMLKISRKLNRIIQRLATRDNYDYIFANAAVLWAPRHVDVTNEVIRLYNK